MQQNKIFQPVFLAVLFSLVLAAPEAYAAQDAVLSVQVDPATIMVDGTTEVLLQVDTGSNTNVSTVESYLRFDPSLVQVRGAVDFSGSSFPLVFRNTVNNEEGYIHLSVSNTTPQSGDDLEVATFTLEGVKAGMSQLTFDPTESAILLPDETNSNVLSDALPGSVTVTGGIPANQNANTFSVELSANESSNPLENNEMNVTGSGTTMDSATPETLHSAAPAMSQSGGEIILPLTLAMMLGGMGYLRQWQKRKK